MFKLPGFSQIQTFDFLEENPNPTKQNDLLHLLHISKEELVKGKPQGF